METTLDTTSSLALTVGEPISDEDKFIFAHPYSLKIEASPRSLDRAQSDPDGFLKALFFDVYNELYINHSLGKYRTLASDECDVIDETGIVVLGNPQRAFIRTYVARPSLISTYLPKELVQQLHE